jgi:hypothetical protein
MTLQEYLTPDPSLRAPAPEPTFIPDTKPSRASRQISLHSKGSVRGFDFINGRKFWYEAELEWKCGLVAKVRPEIVEVVEQPPAIVYIDDEGTERRHTFDWRFVKDDGTKWLFAVKPAALVEKSGIRRIVDLIAKQIPRTTADFVAIFTEDKLTAVDLFNADTIHHAQREEFLGDDAVIAKLTKTLRGTATIASLVERSKLGGYGFNAVVRAIASGRLRLVEYRKIDYDAVVTHGRAKAP